MVRRGGTPRCRPTFPRSISRSRRSIARRRLPERGWRSSARLFRLLPKHKGTEKLQSDLKQKMSQLRDELERGKVGGKKTGLEPPRAARGGRPGGAGRPPNAGKSTLLAALTNARPEIAPYPFTTRVPQPGIMMWQDVPVQLVDLPPIAAEFFEPWVPSVIRSADAALLVVDLASDDVADATVDGARAARRGPHRAGRRASLRRRGRVDPPSQDGDGGDQARCRRGARTPGGRPRMVRARFPIVPVSGQTGEGLETLRAATYHLLGVLRVYTKVPGKPADRTRPFTLPIGSTVLDLAREIHRDFEHSLKLARIWGRAFSMVRPSSATTSCTTPTSSSCTSRERLDIGSVQSCLAEMRLPIGESSPEERGETDDGNGSDRGGPS